MPTAERYWQEVTNTAAREASVRVSATYLQFAEGRLALEEAVGIQATLIATAQRRMVTFNDVLLAAELHSKLEIEYAAAGISWMETPDQQAARLSKAIASVIGDDVAYVNAGKTAEQVKQLAARSIRSRLDRLTTGEVVSSSQWSRQTAMGVWEDSGVITGWYRRISSTACDFCRTLAGSPPEKYIHPVSHRMATHVNCHCSQAWVVGEVEPWQKFVGPSRQMKSVSPEPAEPVAVGWRGDWESAKARLPKGSVGRVGGQADMLPNGAPGPVAQQHLGAVLDAGRALDDELERRLAARAAKGIDPEQRAALDRAVAGAEARAKAARAAMDRLEDEEWQAALDTAKARTRTRPYPSELYDIPDGMTLDEFRLLSTEGYGSRAPGSNSAKAAVYQVKTRLGKSSPYKKARATMIDSANVRKRAQDLIAGGGALEPGTAAYAEALREEVLGLIGEVRTMGGQQVYLNAAGKPIKTGKLIQAMRFADESYPQEWHDALEAFLKGKGRSGTSLGASRRGYNRGGYEIKLSKQSARGHAPSGDTEGQFQVATHELGHSFEQAVPGLREMEWAYSHRRSPRDREKISSIYVGEMGYRDEWAQHYTGKIYSGGKPDASWEIFTTGIESMMSGSPYLERPDPLGYDREFRQWLLGVLSVL